MIEIFDPIHGPIEICDNAKKIIDTPEFQRLRNIKQLGCCYYVFSGACHNRFEHSLGVYHLTKKYIDILGRKHFTDKEIELLSISGLIHDIGHGPFSHLFDEVMNSHHEYRSIEILKYMNQKYSLNYSEEEIDIIQTMLDPKDLGSRKYLYQIVSNKNGIDVDRIDYIMRDTHMIGLNYGIEWLRIMKGSKISNNEIIYSEKVRTPIQDFFRTRYILYNDIYHHHAVRSIEHMMKEILQEIDDVYGIKKAIDSCDWSRFSLFTDVLIDALPLVNSETILLDRIKKRDIYKLNDEFIFSSIKDMVSWKKSYSIKDKDIIIDTAIIKYYETELPTYDCIPKKNLLDMDIITKEYHIKIFNK
jgi:deoxynucleoside triphosphate triphosphohydrolase SAMHD1